jgi:hypothetical protein
MMARRPVKVNKTHNSEIIFKPLYKLNIISMVGILALKACLNFQVGKVNKPYGKLSPS